MLHKAQLIVELKLSSQNKSTNFLSLSLSLSVSLCNIGVGFSDTDNCAAAVFLPAQRIPGHHCNAWVTASWRRSDELVFYGRYHALVGHIMAAKTRPAGMTNCLFIGGKPPARIKPLLHLKLASFV